MNSQQWKKLNEFSSVKEGEIVLVKTNDGYLVDKVKGCANILSDRPMIHLEKLGSVNLMMVYAGTKKDGIRVRLDMNLGIIYIRTLRLGAWTILDSTITSRDLRATFNNLLQLKGVYAG